MTLSRYLLLLLGITLFVQLHAAERNDTLREVVVTGIGASRSIIAPQQLQGKRLEALSVHNVADALRYFSGVQIKDYGGVGGVKTIDVRSMGSQHTGVFYDGIQLGNAQNGTIDLGRYSLDNIDRISIYNGQKSDIFQPARDFASGSAIYIASKRPLFPAGKRYATSLVFRTGSFGFVNPSARFDYKLNDSISASLSAEYTYANGRYDFRYRKLFSDGSLAWDTTATRRNGDIHALRLEAGIYGAILRGSWQGKVYFYDSSRGIPGAIVNNVWKNSQRQWDRNFFAQASVNRHQSERYDWMLKAKYARDRMRYLNPDTTLLYLDNHFTQQEVYLSTVHRIHLLHPWSAALAADWQYNSLESNLANFAKPRRNTLLVSLATELKLSRLQIQASLLMNNVADNYLHSPADINSSRITKTLTRLTPAIFLSTQPGADGLEFHAFAKRIFRMPTFNDLYYTDIGNVSLKPEALNQYDIGGSWQLMPSASCFTNLSIALDGYYNDVNDKIIAIPKGTGQYRWMMTNIGKVKIAGAEMKADISLVPVKELLLHLHGAYTFQSARDFSDPSDRGDGGTYKGQIAYVPKHSFSLSADAAWRNFSLNYSFIYVGARWDNSANIRENYVQPWYTSDISAAYAFRSFSFTLEVNNLLNQQYEVIRNYPMPGRNFKFIVRCDF